MKELVQLQPPIMVNKSEDQLTSRDLVHIVEDEVHQLVVPFQSPAHCTRMSAQKHEFPETAQTRADWGEREGFEGVGTGHE